MTRHGRLGTLERHREEILRLAALHGAQDVRVFGSIARGEDRTGSDVDLLVHLEQGRSLLDLIAFKQDIEDLLHRPVDVVTDRALSPRIRDRVLGDASPL
jgi:predicted nucleotidyltransferase